MTLYALKPRFQALLRPTAASLARGGVTANQVTSPPRRFRSPSARTSRHRCPTRAFLLVPVARGAHGAQHARWHARARARPRAPRRVLNRHGDVVSDVALVAPFA
jgi:CDP-diacylglycerol--glycerol-3-phosphate 3-phosphatidyltransferase